MTAPMPKPPEAAQLDWRDPQGYEYTKTLTRETWPWEFLRRNPKYRAEWTRLAQARPSSRALGAVTTLLAEAAASWGLIPF